MVCPGTFPTATSETARGVSVRKLSLQFFAQQHAGQPKSSLNRVLWDATSCDSALKGPRTVTRGSNLYSVSQIFSNLPCPHFSQGLRNRSLRMNCWCAVQQFHARPRLGQCTSDRFLRPYPACNLRHAADVLCVASNAAFKLSHSHHLLP
jgi:hypothetical protein